MKRTTYTKKESETVPTTITLDEAQAKLKGLIRQMAPGEEVILTDNERPVAKLVTEPVKPPPGLRPPPGLGKGMITFIAPDCQSDTSKGGVKVYKGIDPDRV